MATNLPELDFEEPEPAIIHLYDPTPHNDYIFCSSRGSSRNPMNSPKSIYEFLMSDIGFAQNYSPNTAHDLVFDMRGGRNMEDMITDVILSHQTRGRPTNSFAYIVGGYVDITFREKDRNYCVRDYVNNSRTYYRYEEVTYEEQINESYEKVIYRYAHASNRLKHEGIRPGLPPYPLLVSKSGMTTGCTSGTRTSYYTTLNMITCSKGSWKQSSKSTVLYANSMRCTTCTRHTLRAPLSKPTLLMDEIQYSRGTSCSTGCMRTIS